MNKVCYKNLLFI